MKTTLSSFFTHACLLVACCAAQHSDAPLKKFPDHLILKGDAPAALKIAAEFSPRPFDRGGTKDGIVRYGPFYCSKCEEEKVYDAKTELPPKPKRVGKRPISDILSWWEADQKARPIVLATEHSVILCDLGGCPTQQLAADEKAGLEAFFGKLGKEINAHQRAHLFAHRYLRMQARFFDLMCLDRTYKSFIGPLPPEHLGSKGRSEIYLFAKEASYREFGRHFFGAFGAFTSWWWHAEEQAAVASIKGDSADPVLSARFDHQIAHTLIYQYRNFIHHLPIWVTEGVGHFFERRHASHENTLCILGSLPNWALEDDDWWRLIKLTVQKGEDLPLTQLGMQIRLDDLKPAMHPQAWSMVSFMIAAGNDRFRRFIDTLKSKQENESLPEVQFRAIQTAYDTDLVTFQRAWRAWVTATRPLSH